MRYLIFLPLMLVLALSNVWAKEAPAPDTETAKSLPAADAKKMLASEEKKPVVVDVRTPAEFKDGHIAGAININFFGPRFEEDILKLPKDQDIILYCKSGRRSEAAAEFLAKSGYPRAFTMAGGLTGWIKTGGKTVKEEAREKNSQ